MKLIALAITFLVFISTQAEDCLNYDTPIEDNVMLKDVQEDCKKKSAEDKVDYVRCIECKLRFIDSEKKVPNFERYKEFLTKMIKDDNDKEILVKAVDECKESEYVGDDKFEKYVTCWQKKFVEVCRKDPRVSGPRGIE